MESSFFSFSHTLTRTSLKNHSGGPNASLKDSLNDSPTPLSLPTLSLDIKLHLSASQSPQSVHWVMLMRSPRPWSPLTQSPQRNLLPTPKLATPDLSHVFPCLLR